MRRAAQRLPMNKTLQKEISSRPSAVGSSLLSASHFVRGVASAKSA